MVEKKKNIINFFSITNKHSSNKIVFNKNTKKNNISLNINIKKIKVIGNFFKLKFLNKKKIIKFSLCLAHKIYLLNQKKKFNFFLKRIKKNKVIFLQQNKKTNKFFLKNNLVLNKLKKKRKLNSYTKKGIRFNTDIFSFKIGKKTTY